MALLHRRTAEEHCEEALLRSRAGDYRGALAAADKAVGLAPDNAMAHHLRGWALSDLGRHEPALEAFRRALALDPAMTYVQYKIAFELLSLGRAAEALAAADLAVAAMPGDCAPLILRGAVLVDLGRYSDALDAFTAVLEREPAAPVYCNRARILRYLGRYPEAVADYDAAIALVPAMPDAREERGITLAMAGRYDDALAEFETAAAARSSRSLGPADVWSAAIAWHRGDAALARTRFERARDKPMGTPRGVPASLRAIVACALAEADPAGIDAAASALREQEHALDPVNADIIGRLCDLLGDPPMAGIDRLRAIVLAS